MKTKELICSIFGHRPNSCDVSNYVCKRCGRQFKINWPRPEKKEKNPIIVFWVVGKIVEDSAGWEFQGLFDTEDKAVEACSTEDYFIGPAELNKMLPNEKIKWEGAYYPKIEEKP